MREKIDLKSDYSIQWYMNSRLEDQIDWYEKKATANKKWYFTLVVFDIVLSAAIPLSTLFIDLFSNVTYLVALLGTIVTVISGALSTFQFQKNWIEYRTTSETLKHEKYLFLSNVEPYKQDNKDSIFINNVESLISKETTNWAFFIQKTQTYREEEKNEK